MTSFRQIEERNVSAEVELMKWSPKLDLIALALAQGEVALHRLSWKRVWLRAPPGGKEAKTKVRSLAWRPDGKLLAIAYDIGVVSLCDVENSEVIHGLELDTCVSTMAWVSSNAASDASKGRIYRDHSATYLPKLPSLNKGYGSTSGKASAEDVEDSKKLKNQEDFNVLVVGTTAGRVLLYAYGVFPSCAFETGTGESVASVAMTEDLGRLTVVVERDCCAGRCLHLKSYKVPLLREKAEELQIVALKYGQVASLLGYLSATITAITEAWEDILLEIDSKLANYAQEKRQSSSATVSDDFLELLMFGTPSDALEKFLLHDLTEKGLKKLGQSVELCYSNIQRYVLKNLQSVSQSLYFHFLDLRGMARWENKFGALGLSEGAVLGALRSAGAFLMKSAELLQVIDSSTKNFKAFFRWLYTVILRHSDEPVPSEVTRVTQRDINFVANFLTESFAVEWDEEKSSSFRLERVGQYLKNEELAFPPELEQNDWLKFLDGKPDVRDSELLVPHDPKKSLVQQHGELERLTADAFVGPADVLSGSVGGASQIHVAPANSSAITHATSSRDGRVYTAFVPEPRRGRDTYVFRESTSDVDEIDVVRFVVGTLGDDPTLQGHVVIDVDFYSPEILSLLLAEEDERSVPILVQFPTRHLQHYFYPVPKQTSVDVAVTDLHLPVVDVAPLVDGMSYRRLENTKVAALAVSGPRKVACVLFQSRRRVKLFEMDAAEEEGGSPSKSGPDLSDLQEEDKEESF